MVDDHFRRLGMLTRQEKDTSLNRGMLAGADGTWGCDQRHGECDHNHHSNQTSELQNSTASRVVFRITKEKNPTNSEFELDRTFQYILLISPIRYGGHPGQPRFDSMVRSIFRSISRPCDSSNLGLGVCWGNKPQTFQNRNCWNMLEAFRFDRRWL